MAAHPCVSYRSLRPTLATPLAFRRSGLTRRKRSCLKYIDIAPAVNSNKRRFSDTTPGPSAGRNRTEAAEYTHRVHLLERKLYTENDADRANAAMEPHNEEERGTRAGTSVEAIGSESVRRSRMFSDPGVAENAVSRRDSGTATGAHGHEFGATVSSARGITMDIVHGSIRRKSLLPNPCAATPGSDADPPVNRQRLSDGMSCMVDLEAAVNEVAAEERERTATKTTTTQRPPSEVASEAAHAPEDDRGYRATSSATLPTTAADAAADRSQGPSKRAKSGALPAETDGGGISQVDSGAGDVNRTQAGMDRPHAQVRPYRAGALAMRIAPPALVAAAAAAQALDGNNAPADTGKRGERAGMGTNRVGGTGAESTTAVASGTTAGVEETATSSPPTSSLKTPSMTNDEWIAMLVSLTRTLPAGMHPEDCLHNILRARGYSTEMVAVKETVFHKAPDAEQVAAYDKAILRAVLDEDEPELEKMRTAGRRMDACNRFGDSVLHMACRRGRPRALSYLLRACGSQGVMLSDDFGRTVMHDACWTATPRFDVASTVLDADTRLLRMLDSRGSSPLQYVPQDQWPLWCAFFESRKEIYWPPLAAGEEDLEGLIPSR